MNKAHYKGFNLLFKVIKIRIDPLLEKDVFNAKEYSFFFRDIKEISC